MATDLTSYHRERRAAVEHLNRSMLGGDDPAARRKRRLRTAAKLATLVFCAAVAGVVLAVVAPI